MPFFSVDYIELTANCDATGCKAIGHSSKRVFETLCIKELNDRGWSIDVIGEGVCFCPTHKPVADRLVAAQARGEDLEKFSFDP